MAKSIAIIMRKLLGDRAGVSSTEFGIIVAVIGLASLQALTMLGEEVEQNFDETGQTVAQSQADPFAKGRGASNDPKEPATAGASGTNDAGGNQSAKPVEPAFAAAPPIEYNEVP